MWIDNSTNTQSILIPSCVTVVLCVSILRTIFQSIFHSDLHTNCFYHLALAHHHCRRRRSEKCLFFNAVAYSKSRTTTTTNHMHWASLSTTAYHTLQYECEVKSSLNCPCMHNVLLSFICFDLCGAKRERLRDTKVIAVHKIPLGQININLLIKLLWEALYFQGSIINWPFKELKRRSNGIMNKLNPNSTLIC